PVRIGTHGQDARATIERRYRHAITRFNPGLGSTPVRRGSIPSDMDLGPAVRLSIPGTQTRSSSTASALIARWGLKLVARASRPCESERTGRMPVPLIVH